jgi:metal-responsive CopG/Arc/MetJ family transcriptional regulator
MSRREKKAKASITLSAEILRAADAVAGRAQRSALVERAMRAYLRELVREARSAHDLAAINASAEVTNRESDELLDLQAWPE